MIARLYNFEGKEVVPSDSTFVISYITKITGSGFEYKQITEHRRFNTYEEAQSFLEQHSSANYRIVGYDAFVSPVPLERLEGYSLVYKSPTTVVEIEESGGFKRTISDVEIFEYAP